MSWVRIIEVKDSHVSVASVKNSHEFFTGVTNACEFFKRLKLDICKKKKLVPIKISKFVVRIFHTYRNVTYNSYNANNSQRVKNTNCEY